METLWQDVMKDIRIHFTDGEHPVPSKSSERFKELLESAQETMKGHIQANFEECRAQVEQARIDILV